MGRFRCRFFFTVVFSTGFPRSDFKCKKFTKLNGNSLAKRGRRRPLSLVSLSFVVSNRLKTINIMMEV